MITSPANASDLLWTTNIFGFDNLSDTLWKNFFSVNMIVDSAFATSTNTSLLKYEIFLIRLCVKHLFLIVML